VMEKLGKNARRAADLHAGPVCWDARQRRAERGDLRAWRTSTGGRASCVVAGIRVFSALRDSFLVAA